MFTDISFKQDQEDSNRSESSADGMSLQDRMRLWFEDTSFEESPEELIPSAVRDDETPEEIFQERLEPEDEEVPESWLLAYREFLTSNSAYEGLLAQLRREFHLVPVELNIMGEIREKVVTSLPSSRQISRRMSPQGVHATFRLDWDIVGFFNAQEYLKEPDEAFEGVITITGSYQDAQAATCTQYIKQMWPLIGKAIIRLVKEVFRGTGQSCQCKYPVLICPSLLYFVKLILRKVPDRTMISASIIRSKFIVQVYGVSVSIVEIGELFAWLGAALRTSPRHEGLMYCTPIIRTIVQDTTSLPNIELPPSSIHVIYEIEYITEILPQTLPAANGQCWHDIFKNPVIVRGYPIPRRLEWNTGLEISLNIMAGLAQTQRVNRFKEKNIYQRLLNNASSDSKAYRCYLLAFDI